MVLVTDASVGRVLGGAQIVPAKNRESFLLSKNVCWCWLRMLLLAESVPVTMLDPKALGTAFQKKNKRSEWNCTSSPSLNNAADYKGGGVASPQASWIIAPIIIIVFIRGSNQPLQLFLKYLKRKFIHDRLYARSNMRISPQHERQYN